MASILNLSHELNFDSLTVISNFAFLLQGKFAYCHTYFFSLDCPNQIFICPARWCIISSEVLVDPVIQMMHIFLPLRVSSYKYTGKDSLMICHSDADHEVLQQSKAFCLLFKGYWKLSSTEFFHVDTDMSIKSSDVGCMCKWVEWREKCCGSGQSWLTSSQSFMKWLTHLRIELI